MTQWCPLGEPWAPLEKTMVALWKSLMGSINLDTCLVTKEYLQLNFESCGNQFFFQLFEIKYDKIFRGAVPHIIKYQHMSLIPRCSTESKAVLYKASLQVSRSFSRKKESRSSGYVELKRLGDQWHGTTIGSNT